MKKCLMFRVKGNYARFRKSYTTVSALTYLIMHPIATKGLIGALCGIDRKDLFDWSSKFDVSIQMLSTLNKDMQAITSLNYNSNSYKIYKPKNQGVGYSTNNYFEFLRDVHFRIFVKAENAVTTEIYNKLIDGNRPFTPFLGASECVASIEVEDIVEVMPLEGILSFVSSYIPKDVFEPLIMDNSQIHMDNIPIQNNKLREYIDFKKVWFAKDKLEGRLIGETTIYKVGEYNVCFL